MTAPNRKQRRAAGAALEFPAAVQAHQAGDLATAERLYRQILAADPRHLDSLCNLGLLAFLTERKPEAAELFERAVRVSPGLGRAHANLGAARRELGQHEAAAAALAEALRLDPADWQARLNLGLTLRDLGREAEALPHLEAVVGQFPDNLQARFQLASALAATGDDAAAVVHYLGVIEREPGIAAVWTDLGIAQRRLGRAADAEAAYRRSLEVEPGNVAALFNLASLMQRYGRYDESLAIYEQLIAAAPGLVPARVNYALALLQLGRPADAAAVHEETLRLAPGDADALCGLGDALRLQGRVEEAAEAFERATRARPTESRIWKGYGIVLQQLVRLDEAVAALQEAVRLDPGPVAGWVQLALAKARACDWEGRDEIQAAALARIGAEGAPASAFAVLTLDSSPAQQLAAGQAWAAEVAKAAAQPLPPRPPHDRPKIRVGYLSADFKRHATAFLATGLFEAHDRQRFEVVAYSLNPSDGTPDRARLEAAFDRFVDLTALSHEAAAAQIHADEVDILVDLKGYTGEARTEILAHRPAPLQVAWLGYPGTMGASFIDYAVADPVVAPDALAPFFSEALIRLPGSYQSNMPRPISVDLTTRPHHGLPPDGFVFCSFNNSYKITPAVFDVWMRLLAAVPGSVLWLLDWNETASAHLRREAAARGMDPARLVFAPPMEGPHHLARHRHADLFLDTLPVCAHTTASDALWAGLPLVSCAGETFIARVSASLLTAIGLPELVTTDLARYEALALHLATHPDELAAIRARLWDLRLTSSLYDPARFARHLEAGFEAIWARHKTGQPPAAVDVAA